MKTAIVVVVLLLPGLYAGAQRRPRPQPRQDMCRIPDAPVAVTPCEPASIYTADVNRAGIEAVLNRRFQGFTLVPARGCWRQVCEASLIIQIAGAPLSEVRQAAEEIRIMNQQQSVLVVAPRMRRTAR